MKLVCPNCGSRLFTLYIQSTSTGQRRFAALGEYYWCNGGDCGIVEVPTIGPKGWFYLLKRGARRKRPG